MAEVRTFFSWKGRPRSPGPRPGAAGPLSLGHGLFEDRKRLGIVADLGWDPHPDFRQAHETETLLADGGSGPMPHKFVSEDATDVEEGEGPAGVLEDAAVLDVQDVFEIRLAPLANPGDVGIEPRLEGTVAGPPRHLDELFRPRRGIGAPA